MNKNRFRHAIRPGAVAVALVAVLPLTGCAALDVFDWRADEPLPPVTGNVIATSSNVELRRQANADPLAGIEGQAGQDGTISPDGTEGTDGAADPGGTGVQ